MLEELPATKKSILLFGLFQFIFWFMILTFVSQFFPLRIKTWVGAIAATVWAFNFVLYSAILYAKILFEGPKWKKWKIIAMALVRLMLYPASFVLYVAILASILDKWQLTLLTKPTCPLLALIVVPYIYGDEYHRALSLAFKKYSNFGFLKKAASKYLSGLKLLITGFPLFPAAPILAIVMNICLNKARIYEFEISIPDTETRNWLGPDCVIVKNLEMERTYSGFVYLGGSISKKLMIVSTSKRFIVICWGHENELCSEIIKKIDKIRKLNINLLRKIVYNFAGIKGESVQVTVHDSVVIENRSQYGYIIKSVELCIPKDSFDIRLIEPMSELTIIDDERQTVKKITIFQESSIRPNESSLIKLSYKRRLPVVESDSGKCLKFRFDYVYDGIFPHKEFVFIVRLAESFKISNISPPPRYPNSSTEYVWLFEDINPGDLIRIEFDLSVG